MNRESLTQMLARFGPQATVDVLERNTDKMVRFVEQWLQTAADDDADSLDLPEKWRRDMGRDDIAASTLIFLETNDDDRTEFMNRARTEISRLLRDGYDKIVIRMHPQDEGFGRNVDGALMGEGLASRITYVCNGRQQNGLIGVAFEPVGDDYRVSAI